MILLKNTYKWKLKQNFKDIDYLLSLIHILKS